MLKTWTNYTDPKQIFKKNSEKNQPPLKDVGWYIFNTRNHLTAWKQITNIR